ncbi:TorF family putative porin [Sphingobium sufflavum]|uniref:TorF family putative porin n=1 Tax=Sphingobium sufflavum TaxID=1129547 RepID=UPI001F2A2416|nr:TorF family putative porin [Sphingobium sufflavum]MCE7798323.1 TorF family putative porin [Sphingobium sufflavum]
MKKELLATVGLLLASVATPALAQEEAGPITVSGSVAFVTDYRFRGVSQTNEKAAIQGGITVSHETGLYAGVWGSNLAGWGQFGGSNMELDLIAGYKLPVGDAVTVDVGATWYMYPGGSNETDFIEPYVKVSGTFGPAALTAGVAYAPAQEALGNWSAHPQSRIGDKEDNLYLWGDVSGGIPSTPVTVKAHLGYSDGNPGLGPNGTSIAPTGTYFDWMLGADLALGKVTLGVAYVDTSIKRAERLALPGFSNTLDGSSISSGRIVGSISASF